MNNKIKKLLIIAVLLVPQLGNSGPTNLGKILQDFKMEDLNMLKSTEFAYFTNRHRELAKKLRLRGVGPESNPIGGRAKTIYSYKENPVAYDISKTLNSREPAYYESLDNANNLRVAVDDIRPLGGTGPPGSAAGLRIPENVYSVGFTGKYPLSAGDYVVAHGKPLLFYENEYNSARDLGYLFRFEDLSSVALGDIKRVPAVYVVENPLEPKPIGFVGDKMSIKGPVLYNYGKSLKVTKITKIDITEGEFAGSSYHEVRLIESPTVDPKKDIYTFNSEGDRIPVRPSTITNNRIPRYMQVELSGPTFKDAKVGPDTPELVSIGTGPDAEEGAVGGLEISEEPNPVESSNCCVLQ